MWSDWLVFCDCGFQSVCPLMEKDKRLMKTSWWNRLSVGETGYCLMGSAKLNKSLIQFSVDGWGCVPCLLFYLRPNYGGGNDNKGSVQLLSCVRPYDTPWTAAHQASHPSTTPRVYSNSCPLSQWCHPAISSSVVPSLPALNPSQHQGLFQWISSSH